MLASGGWDQRIKLWDASGGEELASLLALDRDEWLVVTPDGLFDGSPAAWGEVLWRFSPELSDVAPVEIFFNEYFHPNLLADIVSGERPSAPINIRHRDRRQPQVSLTLISTAPGAGVVPVNTRKGENPRGSRRGNRRQ